MQTVNARRLHGFLQSAQDFSTWIKNRIEKYSFEEGKDFAITKNSAPQNYGAGFVGQNRVDYHVSLDMAKELAMVERSDKGREARRYFIDCERKAVQAAPVAVIPNFDDPVAAAEAWLAERSCCVPTS
ncbi:antA/AntB antirepressor family protein [Rugamonas aquatica]|uniref:AntA/AntB antirepressor domain-containing protein n=1 Tax=Rugamonas aquatica TaxID=2743357 RepID=A0A6A7N3W0_9BURK|nr:hypothetical protein [Rugamonas aquatica]